MLNQKIVDSDSIKDNSLVVFTSRDIDDKGHLKRPELLNNLQKIERRTFFGIRYLTNITLPEGITTIEERAFEGCRSLRRITLPESLTTIAEGAFSGCTNLTHITLSKRITTIGAYAFANCRLTSITLPEGVTTIKNNAFYKCEKLEHIVLPESLTTIEEGAFSGCTNLTYIILPKRLTRIEKNTFKECINLTRITLPESIIAIEDETFDPRRQRRRVSNARVAELLSDSSRYRDIVKYKGLNSIGIDTNNEMEYQRIQHLLQAELRDKCIPMSLYQTAKNVQQNAINRVLIEPKTSPMYSFFKFKKLPLNADVLGYINGFSGNQYAKKAIKEMDAEAWPTNQDDLMAYDTKLTNIAHNYVRLANEHKPDDLASQLGNSLV